MSTCTYFRLFISTRIAVDEPSFGVTLGPMLRAQRDSPPYWPTHKMDQSFTTQFQHFKDAGWFCVDNLAPESIGMIAQRVKRSIMYRNGRQREIPEPVVLTVWSVEEDIVWDRTSTIERVFAVLAYGSLSADLIGTHWMWSHISVAGALVDQKFWIPLLGLTSRMRSGQQVNAGAKACFDRSDSLDVNGSVPRTHTSLSSAPSSPSLASAPSGPSSPSLASAPSVSSSPSLSSPSTASPVLLWPGWEWDLPSTAAAFQGLVAELESQFDSL
ncbi:hypothetical protein Tdes44962_MAKER06200 [Teratosphaeria destructans]|uniref:Uncharacterized protein n=1 Tax=Teratosphaeria destructans TaxID=418781 RepID=A0A9W7VXN3_9PEZI|nr:hypothetical protein Tdes44962_MAKER06200 [Teratosphaeria destructans]